MAAPSAKQGAPQGGSRASTAPSRFSAAELWKRLPLVFFVSEEGRETTSTGALRRAHRYRLAGWAILFLVPLLVAYGSITPVIWDFAQVRLETGSPPSMSSALSSLAVALLLAFIHAAYVWFITDLLLFRPPLERLRFNDFLLPMVLAMAYVMSAVGVTAALPSSLDATKNASIFFTISKGLFLVLYVLWFWRDQRELRSLRDSPSRGVTTHAKIVERTIWVLVDSVQTVAIIVSLATNWSIPVRLVHIGLKDLAVLGGLVTQIVIVKFVRLAMNSMESDLYDHYVSPLEFAKTASKRLPLTDGTTILDIGCGNGLRTSQTVNDLFDVKRPQIIGLDRIEGMQSSYEATTKGTFYSSIESVPLSNVDVVLICHFPLHSRRERRQLHSLLALVSEKAPKLKYVVFRGPGPMSVENTVNRVLSERLAGSIETPAIAHLWDRIMMADLAAAMHLTAFDCNPESGRPFVLIQHSYRIGNDTIRAMVDWMLWAYGDVASTFALGWMSARHVSGEQKLVEADTVYVFEKK